MLRYADFSSERLEIHQMAEAEPLFQGNRNVSTPHARGSNGRKSTWRRARRTANTKLAVRHMAVSLLFGAWDTTVSSFPPHPPGTPQGTQPGTPPGDPPQGDPQGDPRGDPWGDLLGTPQNVHKIDSWPFLRVGCRPVFDAASESATGLGGL